MNNQSGPVLVRVQVSKKRRSPRCRPDARPSKAVPIYNCQQFGVQTHKWLALPLLYHIVLLKSALQNVCPIKSKKMIYKSDCNIYGPFYLHCVISSAVLLLIANSSLIAIREGWRRNTVHSLTVQIQQLRCTCLEAIVIIRSGIKSHFRGDAGSS